MRWIVWGDGEVPRTRHRPSWRGSSARSLEPAEMTRVSLAATASYLPERWMTGGRGRGAQRDPGAGDRREVRAARQAHRGRGRARQRPLRARGGGAARGERLRPGRDRRRHVLRLDVEGLRRVAGGAVDRAPARRDTRVRRRVRQRLVRHAGGAAHRARHAARRGRAAHVLVVAACRESYLLDYANERSRFMFNFGDGAVAGLLVKDGARNELLGCHGITDGSFSLAGEAARRAAASRRTAATASSTSRIPRR